MASFKRPHSGTWLSRGCYVIAPAHERAFVCHLWAAKHSHRAGPATVMLANAAFGATACFQAPISVCRTLHGWWLEPGGAWIHTPETLMGVWKHAETPKVAWLQVTVAGPARWLCIAASRWQIKALRCRWTTAEIFVVVDWRCVLIQVSRSFRRCFCKTVGVFW
jgi:hypothetical protein